MGVIARLKVILKPNYYRLHWLYIITITILGALPIFFIEEKIGFEDAVFLSGSSASGTGLSSTDFTKWHWISQAVLPVMMTLGSPILMTLVPVFFRRLFFRRKFTKAQRAHSPEYKALRAIWRIVLGYFILNHVISTIILTIWAHFTPYARELLDSRGLRSYQWAAFLVFSAFGNCGFSLIPENMVPFNHSPLPLLVAAYLTLAGNTAFPILMRVIVWFFYVTANKKDKPVYEHLLQHPRRYFTHLFLTKQTWWLFVTLVAINLLQFVAFLALDWNSLAVAGMSAGAKLLNSFFSSVVTRCSGFNSVDINLLNPAMLILYTVIMYISSTPVVVTVRTTDEGAKEVEEEVEDELEHVKEVAEEVLELRGSTDDIPMTDIVLTPRHPDPPEEETVNPAPEPSPSPSPSPMEAITEEEAPPEAHRNLDAITELSTRSTTGMLDGDHGSRHARKYHIGQLAFDSKGADFGNVISLRFSEKSILFGRRLSSARNLGQHRKGSIGEASLEGVSQNQNQYTDDDEVSIIGEGLLLIPKPDKAVRTQTKLLMTQDTVLLITILFLICLLEKDMILNDPKWDLLRLLFEMASGYGTVGLSMGYPGISSSFSTLLTIPSKILITFVMLMGRHRGLPESIDQAIQLKISDEIVIPSEGTAGIAQPQLQSAFTEEREETPEERAKRKQVEKEMLKKQKRAEKNIRSVINVQEKAQKERQNAKSNGGEFRGMELAQFDVTDVRLNLDDLPEDRRQQLVQEAMLREAGTLGPSSSGPTAKKNLKVQKSYAQLEDPHEEHEEHEEHENENEGDRSDQDESDYDHLQTPIEGPIL